MVEMGAGRGLGGTERCEGEWTPLDDISACRDKAVISGAAREVGSAGSTCPLEWIHPSPAGTIVEPLEFHIFLTMMVGTSVPIGAGSMRCQLDQIADTVAGGAELDMAAPRSVLDVDLSATELFQKGFVLQIPEKTPFPATGHRSLPIHTGGISTCRTENL